MKVKVARLSPTLCDPMDCPWDSPGQNTGVGSLSVLQGIFPTQGSNRGLLHCGQIIYQLSHKGSPRILEWVLSHVSCVQLSVTPWTMALQAPLSMGFSRQEYWSGFPFHSPRDPPDAGIEPRSLALQADSLLSEPLEKLNLKVTRNQTKLKKKLNCP